MPGRPKARTAPEEARSWAKFLQLQCPDTARAERLLRAVEGYAKRPARCDALAQLVLACLLRAVQGADATLAGVLGKAQFWQHWPGTPMNTRQTQALNRVLDGFEGKLTNAKWAVLGKCSADTALRDINDLLARGVLRKLEGRGAQYGI